jgi:hypothetical protein
MVIPHPGCGDSARIRAIIKGSPNSATRRQNARSRKDVTLALTQPGR